MKVRANGIEIEVEDTGERTPGQPVALLVMGLGMQLVAWPPAFVDALAGAGFRVVRFDNRDIGLSQSFDAAGLPNLVWEHFKHRVGLPVRSAYSLRDMAADALGVLDALGIRRAHVVGVSMGGMIAQRIALTAPDRVASLTSIMSSSGARSLPGPKPEILKLLVSRPRATDEAGIVDEAVRFFQAIGSPAFPMPEPLLRERVSLAMRRSFRPGGSLRQMAAVAADTRRAAELGTLRLPTLVMHGKDDPLVPVACGQDTARRIAGAQFFAVNGMGHDLPPGVVDILMQPLLSHLKAHPA